MLFALILTMVVVRAAGDQDGAVDLLDRFEKRIDARISDMSDETRKLTESTGKQLNISDGVRVGTKFECFETTAQCEAVKLLGKGGFGEVRLIKIFPFFSLLLLILRYRAGLQSQSRFQKLFI